MMKLVFATHNRHKFDEVKKLVPAHIDLVTLADIGCTEEIPETGETLEANARMKADYVTEHFGLSCFADDTGLLVDVLHGAPGVYSARYAGEQRNAGDNMEKLLAALENKGNRKARFSTVIALNLIARQAGNPDRNPDRNQDQSQGYNQDQSQANNLDLDQAPNPDRNQVQSQGYNHDQSLANNLDWDPDQEETLYRKGDTHIFEGSVEGEITRQRQGVGGFGYDPIFKPTGYDKTFAELPLEIKNRIGHRGKAIRHLLTFLKK
ncbi:MAG TPA: non-canonical purine NTP pyrophosphatase [Pricia sp.]|nr:non-canonical purine NTP pyrophosphatase [Pricia sp.]